MPTPRPFLVELKIEEYDLVFASRNAQASLSSVLMPPMFDRRKSDRKIISALVPVIAATYEYKLLEIPVTFIELQFWAPNVSTPLKSTLSVPVEVRDCVIEGV